jgi:hypothetical protein
MNQIARVGCCWNTESARRQSSMSGRTNRHDQRGRSDRAGRSGARGTSRLVADAVSRGGGAASGFLASVKAPQGRARDVMVSRVVTVGEQTELREIARLLTAYRIKRVPVLHDGRIIGIVSRADCVRVLGAVEQAQAPAPAKHSRFAQVWAELDPRVPHDKLAPEPSIRPASQATARLKRSLRPRIFAP